MSEVGGVAFDWCAAHTRLVEAYHNVLAGKTVRGVRYRNGEEERETTFSPTNVTELRLAIREARDNCAKANGRPTRFAIQGGPRTRGRGIY